VQWGGHVHPVDMTTPLLPDVVPEIDANPVSFYWGRREGCVTAVVQWFPVNVWGYNLR